MSTRGRVIAGRGLRSGALAGAGTALGFTALHHVLISDIWFSVVPMMAAGAACGVSLAWTYGLLAVPASPRTWSAYVLLHLSLLFALGVASVLMFEPITTIPALLAASGPPSELIDRAMPLTLGFILGSACLVSLIWARNPMAFGSVLVSSAILTVLLGLNVSVLGLVEMSGTSVGVIGEFFALLAAILIGFAIAFLVLERKGVFARAAASEPADALLEEHVAQGTRSTRIGGDRAAS